MEKTRSAEIDLILSALRFFVNFESKPAAFIQKIKMVAEWQPVIALASRHRVLPFVALALDRAGILRDVPAQAREMMEKDVQQAVLDNRAKVAEFRKHNRFFEEAGIPITPLKGIALTQAVYNETPVRRMGDIDLLIKEKDVAAVHQILEEKGFLDSPLINLWHTGISERINGKGSRVREGMDIDLQWRPRLFIEGHFEEWNPEKAWRDAKPCPALGGNVYLLSPPYQASHLLFQAAHDFSQDYLFLYQLLDLAMIIKKYGLLPEKLLNEEAGLHPSTRSLLERLTKTVNEIFFQANETFACSEPTQTIVNAIFYSKLTPKEKVFLPKMIDLPLLSLREKVLMVLGYFFPEPRYVRGKYGQGMRAFLLGWANHWRRLLEKLFKAVFGILK